MEQSRVDHVGFGAQLRQDFDRSGQKMKFPDAPVALGSAPFREHHSFQLVDNMANAGTLQFEAFGEVGLGHARGPIDIDERSEEHTSELQSLMRISYAVFCLNKKKTATNTHYPH